MYSATASRTGTGLVCALTAALAGCVPTDSGSDTLSLPELVLASPALRPPAAGTFAETEPNDDYISAQPVTIEGSVDLTGTMRTGVLDRDLFELGAASAGDRITAELTIASGSDIVLGILDGQGQILAFLDISTTAAGPRKMDLYLHADTPGLYAVITTRSANNSERDYTARLTVQRAVGMPADRPQVVVLNFSGASSVRIGGRAAVNVPPFDAAKLSSRFSGKTGQVIDNVLAMTRETFSGLGVEVYAAGDPAIPEGAHSIVHFGAYDSQLLGLADNVDPYNTNPEQSAILYTDTFALFDALNPDIEAMSQVLANTTCHEIGHLLGLRHTSDAKDIMDTTASARQMMVQQSFRVSNLNPSVMNFGLQSAPNLLSWTVGGVLLQSDSSKRVIARARTIEWASQGLDFYIPRDRIGTAEALEPGVEPAQDAVP